MLTEYMLTEHSKNVRTRWSRILGGAKGQCQAILSDACTRVCRTTSFDLGADFDFGLAFWKIHALLFSPPFLTA